MRPRHPEPLKTFSYLGFHRYFLTFGTEQRAPLFISAAVVDLAIAQISRAASECAFAVPAFASCGPSAPSCGRKIGCLGPRLHKAGGDSASIIQTCRMKLWQRYGYDHAAR
jgi:hypothetical protein